MLLRLSTFAFLIFLSYAIYAQELAQDDQWKEAIAASQDPEREAGYVNLKKSLVIAEGWEETDPRHFESISRLAEYCSHDFLDECEDGELQRLVTKGLANRSKISVKNSTYVENLLRLAEASTTEDHYRDALLVYREALDLQEEFSGKNNIEVSKTYTKIAWVYSYQGDKAQARATMSHALALQDTESSKSTEGYIDLLIQSANLFRAHQQITQADTEIESAAALSRKLWSVQNSQRAITLKKISWSAGQELRISLGKEIVGIWKNTHSVKSSEYAEALRDLADSYSISEEQQQASSILQEVIRLRGESTQPDLVLAKSYSDLAGIYADQKNHMESALMYQKAADLLRDLPENPLYLPQNMLSEAAVQYAEAGDSSTAEEIFVVLERENRLSNVWIVYSTAEELGDVYFKQRHFRMASEKFEIAAATYEALPQKENSQLISLSTKLSQSYLQEGRVNEANKINEQIILLSAAEVTSGQSSLMLAFRNAVKIFLSGSLVFAMVAFLGFFILSRRLMRKVYPPQKVSERESEVEEISLPQIRSVLIHGDGRDLLALRVVNLVLSIATLGIYSFWGKAKVRRYLCGQAEFEGDRFSFHGKGKELLKGWLKAIPFIAFILLFPNILPFLWQHQESILVANYVALIAFLILWPIARIGAYRYRINRMSWRNIRFSFDGKTGRYFVISIVGYLLSFITFGLYAPVLFVKQRRYLFNHTKFGDQGFQFEGRAKDLLLTWICAVPLIIVTFGIFWPWWSALRYRYCWGKTRWNGTQFRCTVSGIGLLWLWVSNIFLVVFSGGLAWSWATLRALRYWSEHLTVEGELSLSEIRQREQSASAVGEGFADFLGFDFGF